MRTWLCTTLLSLSLTLTGGAQEQTASPKTFTARQITVTRQGPTTDYERLTPLIPGTTVQVDQQKGDWYRSVKSGTWIDGRTGTLSDPSSTPAILQGAELDPLSNGDARLTLNCTARPEIQVTAQPSRGVFTFRLIGTDDQIFELVRHSGHAQFLDSVTIAPKGKDTVIEVVSEAHALGGYQIEPGQGSGDIILRLRKPTPKAWRDLVITLDAGHGGPDDPGTVGHGGLPEKELNLKVAKALADQLEKLGASVVMTRTTDTDVAAEDLGASAELQARIDASIQAQAHLFLSIHHNARPSVDEGKSAHGTDVYYYDPISEKLAQTLADPIANAIKEPLRTARYRSFHVIRQSFSPSVLIEFNYLSNPNLEKSVLSQPDYPQKAAMGVIEGLRAYLKVLPSTQ